MKDKIIAINGESWCRNLTGIERLAIEVVKYLDEMVKPGQMELVVPLNAKNLPDLKNIRIVTLPVEAGFMPKWTQIAYQGYVLSNNRISFNFSNTCPYFVPGYEFIHDIYAHLYKEDLGSTRRDRLIGFYSNLMYRRIAKKAKIIFTVSEYTKKTIVDAYKINPDRVKVVYSGVSEYNTTVADESIFQNLPGIHEDNDVSKPLKPFYFTLGSLSKRKNLKWIGEHAELYPEETFVVSGKPLPAVVPAELEKMKTLKNVIFAGYLSDGEVKALEQKCRAFILPTYFEGFGLPPLEALSAGAKIIVSNVTSLPEIYGKCAYYIDPNDPTIDLETLYQKKIHKPDEILEKYTLKNTARRIYDLIFPGT